MDEDDFKTPETEPEFEHMVPKSFVTAERKVKNRALKALSEIEELIKNLNIHEPTKSSSERLNQYSSLINNISFIIKDVDNQNNE